LILISTAPPRTFHPPTPTTFTFDLFSLHYEQQPSHVYLNHYSILNFEKKSEEKKILVVNKKEKTNFTSSKRGLA